VGSIFQHIRIRKKKKTKLLSKQTSAQPSFSRKRTNLKQLDKNVYFPTVLHFSTNIKGIFSSFDSATYGIEQI
jgi:hypothetical protein